MTASQVLADAVQRLKAADVPDAANDARILLAHAMGIERSRLTLILPDEIGIDPLAKFNRSIKARLTRQPVAQIIGLREFYGRPFNVTPDVLDPRPETELLVQTALNAPFETVLDLGCGTGCILLTLLAENPAATGITTGIITGQGVDCSIAAIDVARGNATNLGLDERCNFNVSDWFSQVHGSYDLIVSNPPYITADEMADLAPEVRDHEPEIALTPGGDGLESYRVITRHAMQYLKPRGRLIVEIGHQQAADVQALFGAARFDGITCLQDMEGRDRVILGNKT
ncbi:peptide chain release factor N(5)-glutamine methyltransferase [Profundibacter sp.]